jgi:hypothetical protein
MNENKIDKVRNSKSLSELYSNMDDYKQAKLRTERICKNCKEMESLNLPYDCLTKPDYCLRSEEDVIFVILFEEKESIFEDYNKNCL